MISKNNYPSMISTILSKGNNKNLPVAPQNDPTRIVFTIPDFDQFGELLHERLDGLLYYIEDFVKDDIAPRFMLITNLFDRDEARLNALRLAKSESLESLVYCGTVRQRAILEEKKPLFYLPQDNEGWEEKWRKERDTNWEALANRQMNDVDGVETFGYFKDFRKGSLRLSDIKIGTLKSYFSEKINILKENEKPIISDYFDLEKDEYIGIPLLGTGKFQGIVWIIFRQEEHRRFEDLRLIKRLIKLFALEYNNLLMSWEVSNKQSLFQNAINEVDKENPIQEECRVEEYFTIQGYYHKNRIEKNDKVLNEIKDQSARNREQLLRTATITILLDSFAHNISAHSLTALSWWFRERSEYLGEGKAMLEALGRDLNPLIRHYKLSQSQIDLHQSAQRPTLSRELYPLFKFLLEKGAFWSGITRQTNFAGKISNLYDVLWYDFVNNPLYLGTIANTEEVLKLHIRITIYESEERVAENDLFRNVKTIKKTQDGTLLDGIFGTINLQDFKMSPDQRASVFVEKGDLYEALKHELESTQAFFPGGVIGKHAFFTLLENEIRNVKHFHGTVLQEIQRNGLILNISIHERPFDSQNPQPGEVAQLLKFGVWLNHPVSLDSELLVKRINNLDEDIITPDTAKPRLGGNFQDKICASMLLTSSFNRVQDKTSAVGAIYYPWIKTAGYHIQNDDGKRTEFEVSHRRYRTTTLTQFEHAFAPEQGDGHLKKYFHLWKGANILSIDIASAELNPADVENQGRYRFLHLQNATPTQYDRFKAEGIIRVLANDEEPKSVAEAYHYWMKKWIKSENENQDFVVDFYEGGEIEEDNTNKTGTLAGRLTYEQGRARYENKAAVRIADKDNQKYAQYIEIPQRVEVAIAHGSQLSKHPEKLNYRSDGELIRHFCKGMKLKSAQIQDEGEVFELLEAFAARICIFDHRVHNRMYLGDTILQTSEFASISADRLEVQRKRLSMYRQHLHLDVRPESLEAWQTVQEQKFLNLHFLIVHLSFMESLKDAHGKEYSEERIIEFIDEQVLQGRPASSVGDDFVLVITTGRGRMQWWEAIKANPEYARFTTFRPIESILSAMEDAMQVADDFNLKFNLTKLLFGS